MLKNVLFGAIAGDIAGSTYEFTRSRAVVKSWPVASISLYPQGSTFTDDTVCTIAIADAVMHNIPYTEALQKWCREYPGRGYGGNFSQWINSDNPLPYNSWGNGSAMRVSPIGFLPYPDLLNDAEASAAVSHNHPEGIKGAQVIATAVHLAYYNYKENVKEQVKELLKRNYPDYADKTIADIKPTYSFDVSCQGSVPVALMCFLESTDYENCLQLAISLCGDSDTIAAMAGGIAYAYYKEMKEETFNNVRRALPEDMLNIIDEFDEFIGTN